MYDRGSKKVIAIDLSGKIALVVGGSRGIGAAITETLTKAGAEVVFTHTGNPAYADSVHSFLKRLRAQGGKVSGQILDAADYEGTINFVSRIVAEKGKMDILVHNAGFSSVRPMEEKKIEEWQKTVDINLTSAFCSVKAVIPHMVKQGNGKIVIIGSSAIYSGGGSAIDYAASKSGLVGITMYLARNYAKKGIVTNVIHPCLIETDMLKIRYNTIESLQKLKEEVPVGRIGKPEDIAGLVAFLVSPMGDYICGQSILIDGGRTFCH